MNVVVETIVVKAQRRGSYSDGSEALWGAVPERRIKVDGLIPIAAILVILN